MDAYGLGRLHPLDDHHFEAFPRRQVHGLADAVAELGHDRQGGLAYADVAGVGEFIGRYRPGDTLGPLVTAQQRVESAVRLVLVLPAR
ncbi:hypothetical protein ACIBP6_39320 [Nonomuraea terrae]|uniref:hypothetical protein n=1 Tax=Nonomuraea terrae TaxID=2530383 RepID=UPI0037B11521